MLDPIADKLLVGAALMMLVGAGGLSAFGLYPAIVIMLREILVSGLREYLAGIRIGLPVTKLAKWKTGFQMGALGTLLAGEPTAALLHLSLPAGRRDRRGDAVGRRRADPGDRLGLLTAGLRHAAGPPQPPAVPERRAAPRGVPGQAAVRVFGIVGWSGSGKTTLLTALLPLLRARGLRVSTVKHAHHGFDMDRPGKDSHRHREAGAHEVLVASGRPLGAAARGRRAGAGACRTAGPARPGGSGAGGGVQDLPVPEAGGAPPGARQAADLAGAGLTSWRWPPMPRCRAATGRCLPLGDPPAVARLAAAAAGMAALCTPLLERHALEGHMFRFRRQPGAAAASCLTRPEPSLMRRLALLGLCLLLPSCGGYSYATWWNPPFTTGFQPHAPVGDFENLRRAMGEDVIVKPLTPEPGDVWPGPLQPEPTLEDLVKQGNMGSPEQPVPGSPLQRGTQPPIQGSSTPPGERPARAAAAADRARHVRRAGCASAGAQPGVARCCRRRAGRR